MGTVRTLRGPRVGFATAPRASHFWRGGARIAAGSLFHHEDPCALVPTATGSRPSPLRSRSRAPCGPSPAPRRSFGGLVRHRVESGSSQRQRRKARHRPGRGSAGRTLGQSDEGGNCSADPARKPAAHPTTRGQYLDDVRGIRRRTGPTTQRRTVCTTRSIIVPSPVPPNRHPPMPSHLRRTGRTSQHHATKRPTTPHRTPLTRAPTASNKHANSYAELSNRVNAGAVGQDC